MTNEIILIVSLIFFYATVLCAYKIFGKSGLYAWTVIATIAANIEVLILVNAFGMEQTLGNILFATTFLVTDILSEIEGKKEANKAVYIGIFTSVMFIIITQSWFLYIPSENDWASGAMKEVFSNTPRLMFVGIAVYAIAQIFDVWLYHFVWKKTSKFFGNGKKGLWIRNNCSTLLSQLINTILFNFGAFYGVYDLPILWAIIGSTYVIYVATSILDTPVIYLARKIANKNP